MAELFLASFGDFWAYFGSRYRWKSPLSVGSLQSEPLDFPLFPRRSDHGFHGSCRVAVWHLDTSSRHSVEADLSVGFLPCVRAHPARPLEGHLWKVPQADPKMVEAPRCRWSQWTGTGWDTLRLDSSYLEGRLCSLHVSPDPPTS